MNRRGFLRSAVAALAFTTGLARARLDIIDDPLPDEADWGDSIWIDVNGGAQQFRIVNATGTTLTLDRPVPWPGNGNQVHWSRGGHS
jgi:hypothetical protein